MAKYKIDYKLQCENDVVYHIETGTLELPHHDYYFEHKAIVEAMNILLSMADDMKAGNKKVVDYKIIWED